MNVLLKHSGNGRISSPSAQKKIRAHKSFLFDEKRVQYVSATDEEALKAFQYCCHKEGIIPALEPAHALAALIKIAPKMSSDKIIVMNMCGRGDKDIFTVAKELNIKL